MDFDGSDDIAYITDDDIFSFGDGSTDKPFTLSSWIKFSDDDGGEIISKSNAAIATEYRFYIDDSDKLVLYLNGGTGDFTKTSSSALSENVWHNVLATYDGSSTINGITLYVDGAKVASTGVIGSSYTAMSNAAVRLYIGARNSNNPDSTLSTANQLNSQIDDAKVFNYVLTPQQVRDVYNSGTIRFGP